MKEKLLGLITLIVLFVIATTAALAATYYVSNSGSDSNDGLTQATPWKTLSKVQNRTFNPGDSILLKKGDVWYESLRIPSGGTAGNYITLSSYGNGPKPVISSGSLDAIVVATSNRGYWRIDGLNITATGRAIYFNYWPNDMGPVPGWIIENCDFDTRVYVSGPNTIIRNNVMNGGLRSDSKFGGITFRGVNSNGSIVEGNIVSGFYDRGIWVYNGAGNITVRNNEVFNIKKGSDHFGSAINWDGYGTPLRNTLTYNNNLHDIDGGGICYENTYYAEDYQNFIENAGAGIFIWWYDSQNGSPSSQNSHHNIILNPDNAFVIHYAGAINITNNIFYKTNSFGTERYGLYFTGNKYVQDITFANNIISGQGWVHPVYAPFTTDVFSKFDNNIIVPAGTEIMYRNFQSLNLSDVRTLGYMIDGSTANPLFVDAPQNLRLSEGSPAINAGYDLGNVLDYDHNPVVGVIDIGAFEYQEIIAPQTGDLAVNAGAGGTAAGSSSGFEVPAARSITASPNSGYVFVSWTKTSGDCAITSPASASATVNINSGTCIIQANFNELPEEASLGNLTITHTVGGTTSGDSFNFIIPASKQISAVPDSGYVFVSWTLQSDGCATENSSAMQTSVLINDGWCYALATFREILTPIVNLYVASADSTVDSDLNCVYQIAGQNNEVVAVKINWLKNGETVFADYSAVLPKSNLNVGDTWSCQVNASDSYSEAVQNSNEIRIGTTKIDNTHPSGSGDKDIHIYEYNNTYINVTNQTIIVNNVQEFSPADEGIVQNTEDSALPAEETLPDSVIDIETKKKSSVLIYLLAGVLLIGFIFAVAFGTHPKSDWHVLQFIDSSLKNGFRRESIQRILKSRKYSNRVIKYHMKMSRNETLAVIPPSPESKVYPPEIYAEVRKYVNAQRAHTFTDDEIEEVLSYRGFNKKFIQEVMKKEEMKK